MFDHDDARYIRDVFLALYNDLESEKNFAKTKKQATEPINKTPKKIIELIIELEDPTITGDEIAEDIEGYCEAMYPSATRVEAFVGREEEI